jgi:hypothetical protein
MVFATHLGRRWIFVVPQPEVEPVDIARADLIAVPRLVLDVALVRMEHELYGAMFSNKCAIRQSDQAAALGSLQSR